MPFLDKELKMLDFIRHLRDDFSSQARVRLDFNPLLGEESSMFAEVRSEGERIIVSYSPSEGVFKMRRPLHLVPEGAPKTMWCSAPNPRAAAWAVAASFGMAAK